MKKDYSKSKKSAVARLEKQVNKWIEQGKIQCDSSDKLDIWADHDIMLSYKENLEALKEKYGYQIEAKKEDFKELQDEQIKQLEAQAQLDFKKSISEIAAGSRKVRNEKILRLQEYVRMVAKNYANSLVVCGRGGIGKTFNVLGVLEDEKIDYIFLNSYSTPLDFYHILYENRDKLIVLDDFEGVFGNQVGLSILKSALWGAGVKREICYNTTSEKLKYPKTFEFTGRIIFCLNTINDSESEETRALITRALHYQLDLSFEEIAECIIQIAKDENYKKLAVEERLEVSTYITDLKFKGSDLNFRTQKKAYWIYSYCKEYKKENWKELIDNLIQIDESKKAFYEVEAIQGLSVKERAERFMEKTGLGRTTYFSLKRKFKSPIQFK